jgi:hypothetical protein
MRILQLSRELISDIEAARVQEHDVAQVKKPILWAGDESMIDKRHSFSYAPRHRQDRPESAFGSGRKFSRAPREIIPKEKQEEFFKRMKSSSTESRKKVLLLGSETLATPKDNK